MKLSQIKPNPNNPRLIKDEKFEKLVKSIKDFPKMMELRPLVIDGNNIILGGNMRFKALKELGYKEIPDEWVKNADNLTEEEKRQFIIKDNVGFGDNDWEMVLSEYDVEELEEWGMDVPEYHDIESEPVEDDDFDPDSVKESDVVTGDLICIGPHKLVCGSSLDSDAWAKMIEENSIDLVVTDPPYNVDYEGKTKEKLKIENDKMSQSDFYQFLHDFFATIGIFVKAGSSYYIWHAELEGHNFRQAFMDTGNKLSQCLIWLKNSMVMSRQDYHWKHEPCLYGWKEGAAHNWYSDRKQTTVLEFDRPTRNAEHPTMKPVELIGYQIQNSSKAGDLVADGFLGSGSTMVASHKLNRVCVGVEMDPHYCQVIINRMMELDPSLDVTINGKPYGKEKEDRNG